MSASKSNSGKQYYRSAFKPMNTRNGRKDCKQFRLMVRWNSWWMIGRLGEEGSAESNSWLRRPCLLGQRKWRIVRLCRLVLCNWATIVMCTAQHSAFKQCQSLQLSVPGCVLLPWRPDCCVQFLIWLFRQNVTVLI